MRTRAFYILFLFIALLAGCRKKEYPKPVAAEGSIFYTKLLVNNQPLEIVTGQNGYYMYSSFDMDSSNVYNLIGEFKQTDCNNCTNSIRFQLNDSKESSPNAPIDIEAALKTGSYNFLAGDDDISYTADFTGLYNKTAASLLWDFGDGGTSTELNPKHTFKAGSYRVSLTVQGTSGCQSVIVNTVSVGRPNSMNAYITIQPSSGNNVFFTPHVSGGKAPYKYAWQFGDGDDSTSANGTISHNYAVKGGYGVSLKITDAEGKTVTSHYNAVAGPDQSACAANFNTPAITTTGTRISLSKTSIRFTDASGTTFTSDNALQPASSGLQILSVEDFVKNENNQPVKKIRLKFNCTLYNGNQTVSLQGTEVTVGFAYN